MERTVTCGEGADQEVYILKPMTAGDGLDIQERFVGNGTDVKALSRWTFAVVEKTVQGVDDLKLIPFAHYQKLIRPALEINGFETKAEDAPGEGQAGASPAA